MKVLIIGNSSGSGKLWHGRELSSKHNIPVFEMNKIVWQIGGFNKKIVREELRYKIFKYIECWYNNEGLHPLLD